MMDKAMVPGRTARLWLLLLGTILLVAGGFFLIGGGKLILLGGSAYFLLAGAALLASGLLILRRKPAGALLFGAIWAATLLWALWEVGLSFWPLISRLLAISVGAVVVALSMPLLRRFAGRPPAYAASFGIGGVLALACAAGCPS